MLIVVSSNLSCLFFAELSSSRTKKPGRGEEIRDEKQR